MHISLIVQSAIIPTILKDYQHFGLYTPLPVHDICVSAPTGSGKTLIYVLPIIQVILDIYKMVIINIDNLYANA